MHIHKLLDEMASEEDAFLQTTFLAPILPGRQVRVRIAGIVCTLRISGPTEPGWAILKPRSLTQAYVIAKASLRQIRDYLTLFPAVRLLFLVAQGHGTGLATLAHRGDKRFQFTQPVTVQRVSGVEPFQCIITRFDGQHFWFQEIDRRRNPAIAAYLREALAAGTPSEDLHKPTLTREERDAYELTYNAIETARRNHIEVRLSEALDHANAQLLSYIDRKDVYTVTFDVDGQQYRSTVAKDDLTTHVAGICLNGADRRFDLQSLVGVIRESAARRRLVRVGDDADLNEDAYWQIHPPPEENP